MSAPADARDELKAALATVEGLRVFDVGQPPRAPGAVVTWPRLTAAQYGAGPTDATFLIYLVVPAAVGADDQLYDLLAPAWEAIEGNTPGVVTQASPGTYGDADLPAFELTVEYPL